MRSGLRVAFLTSIITAALVYVMIEWQPGQSSPVERTSSTPGVTLAALPPPAEPLQEADLGWDERNNIEIYRRYSRSVVNITSTTLNYDFFLRPIPSSGTGSGVVLDQEGRIATNYHVIENARSLEVTLWDQSRHAARIVGVDPSNDLAVIQVTAPDVAWEPIPTGTTAGLMVGQKVLAIGNPFGLERTLTTGIISSLGRSIQATNGRIIEGIIQTDAAINPGNSGGPLLNTRGEMIGINTAIVSGSSGIGFAVPVETVNRVTADLITYGRVRRVYIGLQGESVSRLGPYGEALGLGTDSGVLVMSVTPDSPAERGGVRGASRTVRIGNYLLPAGGDVIASIDGRAIRSMEDIRAALEPRRPGESVRVTVFRGGSELNLELTLEEDPA